MRKDGTCPLRTPLAQQSHCTSPQMHNTGSTMYAIYQLVALRVSELSHYN